VSYIVGGGNTSAMHPAFLINQVMRSRIVLPPEPQLKDLVHEIAAATKSEELLQQMIEELKGLREDFEQERAERALREGPYSGIYRFAPANKGEWYGFLGFILTLLAIILPMILNKPEPPTIIIQSHEQEIVQQLKEINERLAEKESLEPGPKPVRKPSPKGHS
jgi:hypothetical protein